MQCMNAIHGGCIKCIHLTYHIHMNSVIISISLILSMWPNYLRLLCLTSSSTPHFVPSPLPNILNLYTHFHYFYYIFFHIMHFSGNSFQPPGPLTFVFYSIPMSHSYIGVSEQLFHHAISFLPLYFLCFILLIFIFNCLGFYYILLLFRVLNCYLNYAKIHIMHLLGTHPSHK